MEKNVGQTITGALAMLKPSFEKFRRGQKPNQIEKFKAVSPNGKKKTPWGLGGL